MQSTGTRTMKLRGRAKAVTFHVFDPRHLEDVLDRDLPTIWREEDAQAAAEARRRAVAKAARTRAGKTVTAPGDVVAIGTTTAPRPGLKGWDAFDEEGLLRWARRPPPAKGSRQPSLTRRSARPAYAAVTAFSISAIDRPVRSFEISPTSAAVRVLW